jgi:hypothetical protein
MERANSSIGTPRGIRRTDTSGDDGKTRCADGREV